jgi:hypothetical protein
MPILDKDKILAYASKEEAMEALAEYLPGKTYLPIGKEVYEISELVHNQYTQLTNIIGTVFIELYKLAGDEVAKVDDSVYFSKALDAIMVHISQVLSVLTGLTVDTITSNITSKQIVYAANIIWKMNCEKAITEALSLKDTVYSNYQLFVTPDTDGADSNDVAGTPLEEVKPTGEAS